MADHLSPVSNLLASTTPASFPASGAIASARWLDPLLIAVAWAVLCLPWIFGLSYIGGDSIAVFYPQSLFVTASLRQGEAPWWNPFEYGGLPVLADPQSLIFTPHTLIGLLLGRHYTLQIFDMTTLACLLAGGLALHRYGRLHADNRFFPLLGAIVFMAGGVAASRLEHVPQIFSYALLPFQTLALRAVCVRPGIRSGVALALALAAGFLNINQVVFLSAFALAPFFLFHLFQSGQRLHATLTVAAATVAALLVASPVLASILEYIPLSNRASLSIASSGWFSLPFFDLASIALPGLYGVLQPSDGFWAPTDISQDHLYIGILPVLVVLRTALTQPRHAVLPSLCLAAAVLWFVFALGADTPLYPALFAHVPGFGAFRRPADGAFLLNFSLATLVATTPRRGARLWRPWPRVAIAAAIAAIGMLAGISLVRYATRTGHTADLLYCGQRAAVGLALLLAGGALLRLKNLFHPLIVPGLALMFAVADFATSGRFGAAIGPPYALSPSAQRYSHVKPADAQNAALDETLRYLRDNGATSDTGRFRIEAIGGMLAGTMPMIYRIASTHGYNPMIPRAYATLVGEQDLSREAKQFVGVASGYDSNLYRELGLRYLLLDHMTMDYPGGLGAIGRTLLRLRPLLSADTGAALQPTAGAYEIWEFAGAYPKAFMPGASGDSAAVRACALLQYRNTKLDISCDAVQATALVVNDNFAPGWSACVNDQPAPVTPYHGLFRSIPVPSGHSQIVLRYDPVPFLRVVHCR